MNAKCANCGCSKPSPVLDAGLCPSCREVGVTEDAALVEAETGLADQERVSVAVAVEEPDPEEGTPEWETWND